MSLDILRRLARSFRATAADGRRTLPCGSFEAYLSNDTAEYLMSVAAPVQEAVDWPAALPALDALFAVEGRHLRLEFFAELAPGLGSALERAGAALDMAAPVMALPSGGLVDGPFAGRLLSADDRNGITAYERVQAAAYGDELTPAAQDAYRPILLAGLKTGRIIAAVLENEGRPVAAAAMIAGPEAAELAGVATVPGARRQGHAAAVCRCLLLAYFAAGGALAWLSAGPMSGGLYRRLGFTAVGTQLNMGRKPRRP